MAAGARLASIVSPPVPGGWTPPPLEAVEAEPVDVAAEPVDVARSWTPLPPEPSGGEVLTGWLPEPLRGGRWDPGRRGLAVLAGVALLATLVSGGLLLRGRPQAVAAPEVLGGSAAAAPAAAMVVVDVAGKVRRPGIVRLPLGSRVDDAVRAAGGPLPGASWAGLNRARKLADGEQVLVGLPPPAGAAGAAAGDGRVDLNAADLTALDALPGIGPVLAQRIVDWRSERGRFASVDQLREVPGIGESKFAALKSKVRV